MVAQTSEGLLSTVSNRADFCNDTCYERLILENCSISTRSIRFCTAPNSIVHEVFRKINLCSGSVRNFVESSNSIRILFLLLLLLLLLLFLLFLLLLNISRNLTIVGFHLLFFSQIFFCSSALQRCSLTLRSCSRTSTRWQLK